MTEELLHHCYELATAAQACRSEHCAWFLEDGGIYSMCLPHCRILYNRMYTGTQYVSLDYTTLQYCELTCLEQAKCNSFTWNENTTLCILHDVNTHNRYSQGHVAGLCHDTGIRPTVSPSTPQPSGSPVTPSPTTFFEDSLIISTSIIDTTQTETSSYYFVILSIILMVLLCIIGFVFYCYYQRNCVEKQLDRISSEFMKRDPKSRRHMKVEPEDEKYYRKREIEAQAASFRDYLDSQISEIKDQLEIAKEETHAGTDSEDYDRFEAIREKISEKFMSILNDASDGFDQVEDKRLVNQKRRLRAADRVVSNNKHSKKRSLTKRDKAKIVNILPASYDEETTKRHEDLGREMDEFEQQLGEEEEHRRAMQKESLKCLPSHARSESMEEVDDQKINLEEDISHVKQTLRSIPHHVRKDLPGHYMRQESDYTRAHKPMGKQESNSSDEIDVVDQNHHLSSPDSVGVVPVSGHESPHVGFADKESRGKTGESKGFNYLNLNLME